MSEENDKKTGWLELFKIAANGLKGFIQSRIQGAENVTINYTVIKDNKVETLNIKPEIPPDTDYDKAGEILDQLLAKMGTPEIESFQVPPDKDIKWASDQLSYAVNSSAAILSIAASMEAISKTSDADLQIDDEGTSTSKPIDLTPKENGSMIKDLTPEPKPKKSDDVDEGEGI